MIRDASRPAGGVGTTAWGAYLATLAVLIGVYFGVPGARPVAVAAVGLVSATAVVYGARRQRSPRLGGWVLLGAGILVMAVGDVVYSVTLPRVRPLDYPTTTDLIFLAAYLPLAFGVLSLGRPRLASRDAAQALDTSTLSLALGLVVWITLVRPEVAGHGISGIGRITAVASWVGFVAVLAACARVLLAWRGNVSLTLLGAGVAAFLVSDFLYGRALVNGSGPDAGPVDLGYLIFGGFAGAAALHSSMTEVASAPYARHRLGPWRLGLLALALLVAPSTLLLQATDGPATITLAVAISSAGVGVLMLVRLAASGRAYRDRAAREHALRLASRALVVATTREQVEAGLATALDRMLPGHTPTEVQIADQDHTDPGSATTINDTPRPGELRVTVASPDSANGTRVVVYRAPPQHLTELTPALEGLAEQAGSAVDRIDLTSRLRSDDRERYFRTLVVTSTDVILISRDGLIEYATPSAQAMFGRDVTGQPFHDIVERDESGMARREVVDKTGLAHETLSPQPAATSRPGRWSPNENEARGQIRRPDGSTLHVMVRRRDLTTDPTVNGIVSNVRDVTAEWKLHRTLSFRATHDSLTGLANGAMLRSQLRTDREHHRGGETTLAALLFIDLDDFKSVNDTYGHEVGDELLTTVGHRIKASLRDGEDMAARLGGDEFAALLRELPDVEDARAAARRVTHALARPMRLVGADIDVPCDASVGLAIAHTPEDFDSLLRRADSALYAAKGSGKGQWRQYEEGMKNPASRHRPRA